jgi:protein ImuA
MSSLAVLGNMVPASARILDELRDRIARIEQADRPTHRVVPFDVAAIDARLPQRGLALGALHEIAGGGLGAVHAAAAALFVAGVLAQIDGTVLWCLRSRDLFAPALAGAGLHPDRVIFAEAGDERTVLLCMEEGLRQAGIAGAVGEVARLPITASRRLQLAAGASGVLAFVIRRWRTPQEAEIFGQPTAAMTRWRITALPSAPLPVPGIGRARWRLELVRVRGGAGAVWDVEACDAQGRLAVPSDLEDRPAATTEGPRRACS